MSRGSIYPRIKLSRMAMGVHPDEYRMPGVTLDVAEHQRGPWPSARACSRQTSI